MKEYKNLFKPISIGHIRLENRVIMGAMHTGLEYDYEKLARFYEVRVKGGAGLIITGGFSPNKEGLLYEKASIIDAETKLDGHKKLTEKVHDAGGYICLQLLHAGRYAYHKNSVSASAIQSPITPFSPRELKEAEIIKQIDDFTNAAKLAKESGYDGVEIMGSEGYLINQFLAKRTNKRSDEWANGARFPVEIIKKVRAAAGKDFLIIYRLSMLDLVEEGSSWDEVVKLAKEIEAAGADVINTGIGWHEARIPTIAAMVPRAAFSEVTAKLKKNVSIPVVAANRINTPEVAEKIIAEGEADMVSMARPLLADPEFVNKAKNGKADLINTCIACNQACLDHTFEMKMASCLVNPAACHEDEFKIIPAKKIKNLAVVGAGPAGLSFAVTAAERGHKVTIFEAAKEIGGQFNLAKKIPGKEEFYETLRYFNNRLKDLNVKVLLGKEASENDLKNFDEVILATGVTPKIPDVDGLDHKTVMNYIDVLNGREVGKTVAVMGAGGIGIDVSEFLLHGGKHIDTKEFMHEWGIDTEFTARGGIEGIKPEAAKPERKIYLLQRKDKKFGSSLGKTTGWIHLLSLKKNGVTMIGGVTYKKIDDAGIHITANGEEKILKVDSVIICAGQEPKNSLYRNLSSGGAKVHVIGGARDTKELDAKRAIMEGTKLGISI